MSHDHEPRHHPIRGIGTNPNQVPQVAGVIAAPPPVEPFARPAGFSAMAFAPEGEGSPEAPTGAGNPNGWDVLMPTHTDAGE